MNKNAFFSGACARAGLGLLSALMIVLAARALAHAAGPTGGLFERVGAASAAQYERHMGRASSYQQQRTVDFIYPEP